MTNDPPAQASGPIGVFDSGVGGLTVLKQIQTIMPNENLVYLADQAHVPYGPRPDLEVQQFTLEISRFLLSLGAKMVVVACNTASAAALEFLREARPDISFVGMEPAIKPGAFETQNGQVGVLATVGTFDSQRYASLMTRFASDITVHEDSCPGLVEQIEAGELASTETKRILKDALVPMKERNVDTLILGCTHYPFVLPLIKQLAGSSVTVIDPAPAVARQAQRVLAERHLITPSDSAGGVTTYTTGDSGQFSSSVKKLLGLPIQANQVSWDSGKLSVS